MLAGARLPCSSWPLLSPLPAAVGLLAAAAAEAGLSCDGGVTAFLAAWLESAPVCLLLETLGANASIGIEAGMLGLPGCV